MNELNQETETETAAPEAPRKRRKYARRKPVARAARSQAPTLKSDQSDDEIFFGTTKDTCPAACVEAAASGKPCCWVTQADRCANPLQTGLQAIDKANPVTLGRFNRLLRWLKVRAAKAS